MKKVVLILCLVIPLLLFVSPSKKIELKNNHYNIYIEENGQYVKQNTNTMPTDGYLLNTSESSCVGGGTITQDFSTREVSVTVTKSDKCDFYFDEYLPTILEVFNDDRYDDTSTAVIDAGSITNNNVTCTKTMAYDGTNNNNLRYIGASPCNYVTFNGETAGWRIIGVMNNISDGSSSTSRIKLVRATSLGSYSYDTSANGTNSGYGYNDWTQADLKTELNGDYLNTSLQANTTWYNGRRNAKNASFNYQRVLKADAQTLFGDAVWNLGAYANSTNIRLSALYTAERGTAVPTGTSGRQTTWTGKVALMYPSDQGYATGGTVRNTCLNSNLSQFSTNQCNTNSWIYQLGSNTRYLTPSTNNQAYATYRNNTYIATNYVYNAYVTYPTIYLYSTVVITGGNGSQAQPFTIGLANSS